MIFPYVFDSDETDKSLLSLQTIFKRFKEPMAQPPPHKTSTTCSGGLMRRGGATYAPASVGIFFYWQAREHAGSDSNPRHLTIQTEASVRPTK
jgi:hypothetical protein